MELRDHCRGWCFHTRMPHSSYLFNTVMPGILLSLFLSLVVFTSMTTALHPLILSWDSSAASISSAVTTSCLSFSQRFVCLHSSCLPFAVVLACPWFWEIISQWNDTGSLPYSSKGKQQRPTVVASGIIWSEVGWIHKGILLFDLV